MTSKTVGVEHRLHVHSETPFQTVKMNIAVHDERYAADDNEPDTHQVP